MASNQRADSSSASAWLDIPAAKNTSGATGTNGGFVNISVPRATSMPGGGAASARPEASPRPASCPPGSVEGTEASS